MFMWSEEYMKKNILALIVMITGLVLICAMVTIKTYSKNKENNSINGFNKEIEKTQLYEREDNKNKKLKTEGKHSESSNVKSENIRLNEEIALIQIPSINLKSVIVQGVEKEQLKYHLGHFTSTPLPGDFGNFSIAGHSSYVYNEILNNLHKVKKGDKIIIKTKKQQFEYEIYGKSIVEPTEMSVLDSDLEKKTITIVTCAEKGKRRLIVKGEILME